MDILTINGAMVDKNDLCEQFSAYGLWELVEDTSNDGDGVLELTEDGLKVWQGLASILDNIKFAKE